MESSKSNSAYFFDSHPFVSIDLFLASEHCSSCFFFEYANLSYNFTNLVLLTSLPFFSMVGNVLGWSGGGGGGKGFAFTESLCRVVHACWWHCRK